MCMSLSFSLSRHPQIFVDQRSTRFPLEDTQSVKQSVGGSIFDVAFVRSPWSPRHTYARRCERFSLASSCASVGLRGLLWLASRRIFDIEHFGSSSPLWLVDHLNLPRGVGRFDISVCAERPLCACVDCVDCLLWMSEAAAV